MIKTLNLALISLLIFIGSETIQQEIKPNFQADLCALNTLRLEELKEKTEIVNKNLNVKNMKLFSNSDVKTYMDYRKITNKSSKQYKLIHSENIFVNKKGFLQTNDGFIGVAMGSYFGDIGSKFIIELSTGKQIKVIKVERKADIHTDFRNFAGSDNLDIIEFVVDTKKQFMLNNIGNNKFIFNGNFNNCNMFNGKIISIKKILR